MPSTRKSLGDVKKRPFSSENGRWKRAIQQRKENGKRRGSAVPTRVKGLGT
jgi:hypothetical protein